MPGDLARIHDRGAPVKGDLRQESGVWHDAAERIGGICHGNGCRQETTRFPAIFAQRREGALSPTTGCSTGHWLDPSARANSTLSFKAHGPPERELADKTADQTLYERALQRRRGHSSTTALDSRIRRFYSTLPSLTLAPAPIWRIQHTIQETISLTLSNGRKHMSGLVPPLPTPSFISLCRRVVRLAQTGRAQVGDTFLRVPAFGRGDRSSTPSLVVLFCFIKGTLIPHVWVGSGFGVGGGIGSGNEGGGGGGGGNRDVNGDGDGDEAGTRTGVEASEGTQDGNGGRAGTGVRTGVETRGRTQDRNGDGSRDGNESGSGDGNGDEDGNANRNKDGIGEGGGKAKKSKKPHKSCRRDVGNGGDLGGEKKNVEKKRLIQ